MNYAFLYEACDDKLHEENVYTYLKEWKTFLTCVIIVFCFKFKHLTDILEKII